MIAKDFVTVTISNEDFFALIAESLGDLVEKPYLHQLVIKEVMTHTLDDRDGWYIRYSIGAKKKD